MYTNDYVDFSEYNEDILPDPPKINSLYKRDDKPILFDDKTMNYYKIMRYRKMDPIILQDIDYDNCFKFYDEWNPYTGERLGKDPYGPLCFHPDSLIKYYYENRLNNLWVNDIEQDGDYYQGYYAEAVGAGFDIYIQSRGYNPEKYLFRLPIIDCYCTPDIDNQTVITMGPILTDNEVAQIDEIAKYYGHNYLDQYGKPRPSLFTMKKLYDTAISIKPPLLFSPSNIINDIMPQQLKEIYAKTNRIAVDKLKLMKG